jgi:hypothetical protein
MLKSLAVYANSPGHLTLSQDQQAIAAKPAINQLRRHIGTTLHGLHSRFVPVIAYPATDAAMLTIDCKINQSCSRAMYSNCKNSL